MFYTWMPSKQGLAWVAAAPCKDSIHPIYPAHSIQRPMRPVQGKTRWNISRHCHENLHMRMSDRPYRCASPSLTASHQPMECPTHGD
ncbi:hypothetical protein IG631_00324 [Alternaria alternata]|nr:hypothetical protein IG631_00324 [Alternaria alternata]